MVEVVMPAHGMAMTEGVLIRWLRDPGDAVSKGEPIAEIETDKSNAEVVSPVSGTMGEPMCAPGAVIAVGSPIVQILDAADDDDSDASRSEREPVESTSVENPGGMQVQVPSAPVKMRRKEGSRLEELAQLADIGRIPDDPKMATIDLTGLASDVVDEWLTTMVLIREFEDVCDALALAGKIPGGIHSAAGQEAAAVGTVRALAATDIITSTHRSHHHSLAKGLTPASVMAELYGKATGCLGGRAGHMHLADFSRGLFGSNGVVGGGLGIAMGAALAADMRGVDQVAVGHFGDGGANTGRVWEFVNLASIWKLPLLVVCENNQYAVESHIRRMTAAESIADRAAAFGLPAVTIDGQDVATVYRTVSQARERARSGGGPSFIEVLTYRYQGHNTGDRGNYREQEEIDAWRRLRDPIARLRRSAEEGGTMHPGRYDEIVTEARVIVAEAVEFAERSPWPDPATALDQVTSLGVREGQSR
jgi:pyruvate dehydrogenase E1 component alpha subunit